MNETVELGILDQWPGEERSKVKTKRSWISYYSFRIKLVAIFSFLLLILR